MSKPFDLKFIPFSQLHISELNMRHSETAPEIDDILPSVKERGIRNTALSQDAAAISVLPLSRLRAWTSPMCRVA